MEKLQYLIFFSINGSVNSSDLEGVNYRHVIHEESQRFKVIPYFVGDKNSIKVFVPVAVNSESVGRTFFPVTDWRIAMTTSANGQVVSLVLRKPWVWPAAADHDCPARPVEHISDQRVAAIETNGKQMMGWHVHFPPWMKFRFFLVSTKLILSRIGCMSVASPEPKMSFNVFWYAKSIVWKKVEMSMDTFCSTKVITS